MGVVEDDLDITGAYRWPSKIRDGAESVLPCSGTLLYSGVYHPYDSMRCLQTTPIEFNTIMRISCAHKIMHTHKSDA